MTAILGAGLSGLIAATLFPTAPIHEARDQSSSTHKALLRFRSDSLSRLTGIPFHKVLVHKSIWAGKEHVLPNISHANNYSRKTNGMILDRSLWNVDPVERWIAPENLIEQMIESVGRRIHWNSPWTGDDIVQYGKEETIISTMPMPVLIKLLKDNDPFWMFDDPEFGYKSISVDRYRVSKCDVYQTVYYPEEHVGPYRASITGDMLIVESQANLRHVNLAHVLESFGLYDHDVELLEGNHEQRFGKITPIDDHWRRKFIYEASSNLNVFSMGRFAIWKNILLDDVVQDGAIIKRLMNQGRYGAALHNSKDRT